MSQNQNYYPPIRNQIYTQINYTFNSMAPVELEFNSGNQVIILKIDQRFMDQWRGNDYQLNNLHFEISQLKDIISKWQPLFDAYVSDEKVRDTINNIVLVQQIKGTI